MTRQSLGKETVVAEHGDDAGRCCNGLSARSYRAASAGDRALYRKWIFGMVLFYSMLLLISGVVAIVVDSNPGQTKFTTRSAQPTLASSRSN
jgi:hypothetical protein